MPIKVCHVTSMHRPFDTRIFHKECTSLSKEYDVYLVASNVETQFKDGIHVVGVKMPPHGIRKMLTTKPIIEAAKAVDAEVYHFHDPELMGAGLKLKRYGKKVIFDYHENYTEFLKTKTWIPKPLRVVASKLFGFYESRILPKYDAVITVTPFIVERLEQYNHNVFQVTNYPKLQNTEDNRQWSNSICFVGGIVPEWMFHKVIEALSDTKAKLELAGAVRPETYLDELKAKKGWSQVEYHGRISYEQVFPLIQKSIAGLAIRTYKDPNMGYKKGSLGVNKFFEYMMAGVPVIASDMEVWREIIDKYHCGIIVDPESPESIAAAINYLLDNPVEAIKMGDAGKKAAETYYHWGTQEKILLGIYKQLLHS